MNKTIRLLMRLVEGKELKIVLALSILIVLVGILYSFYLGNILRFWDEHEYYDLAKNLATKHIYSLDGEHPSAFRPPVYPFLLSLLISLGASISSLRILNFIILGLSIYLLYLIVKNQSSKFAGLISALLAVCYPVLFYSASIFVSELLGIFLFLLILLLLFSTERVTTKSYILIGFLYGFLLHTVPSFIFSLFIIILWLLFSQREKKIKAVFAIVLPVLLIITIWAVRNYAAFNSFVFVSTHGGRAFYHGNFEGATANPVSRTDYFIPPGDYTGLNEAQVDRYYRSKAIKYILEHKTRTIKFYFLKVLNYFNFHNKLSSDEESYVDKYKDIVMLLTYGPLLLLFLIRLLSFRRFKLSEFELLLITLYLSSAFFLAIFHTRIRFRLPFDFLLIAIVAMFINNWIKTRVQQTNKEEIRQ